MNKTFYLLLLVSLAFGSFAIGWITHSVGAPSLLTQTKPIKKISIFEKIKQKKRLNVVFLNAPSAYLIGVDGPQGFEYDLLKSYAQHLDVKLHIITAHTVAEALELGKRSDVDIVSASLAKTPKREKIYNFGPSYFEVQEEVICNRDMLTSSKFPRDVEDLSGLNIVVGTNTSYIESLRTLQKDGYDINVTTTDEYSTEELLEKVAKNEINCTVADSNIYSLNLRYIPNIVMAFSISKREQLAWILPKNAKQLESDMYKWLNEYNQKGLMTQLKDHYYSYILFSDYYNTTMFYKRIRVRLSKYQKDFIDAAQRYDIPWTLLAALSYQESHWNPRAKSFTGVRGLMMLTRKTAKMHGVKNRLDPIESIVGGTKHLKQMLRVVPEKIKGENRLKFALAAYNIGFGHVKDAQKLAKKLGLNENIWSDLKIVLPLLSQKKYYRNLKYGYARGSEPVKYVESIYNYKDILEKKSEELVAP